MATDIRIARALALPLDAITETFAVLGKRGSGKSTTATVLAEELLDRGQQIVVLDPTDVWWGLKSSADGTRPGYPVLLLGGKRRDLPLAEGDGATIADFAVDERVPIVCSLRHLESKKAAARFITDFARRLYHRKGQEDAPTPIHVFIDEASLVVPQRVQADEAPMVGSIQRLVRQGRSSGIGVTLIDQRAASVNKEVLTQLEVLVCHKTTSPQDRAALRAWVEQHDAEGHEAEFLASLASLEQGEAWFWSPGAFDLFKRVQVRPARTFDSRRTPKAGETVVAPTRVAAIDLDAMKAKLGASVERARAEDPKELQKRIRELERQLADSASLKGKTVRQLSAEEYQRGRAEGERAAAEKFAREFRRLIERDLSALGGTIDRAKKAGEQIPALFDSIAARFLALAGTLDSAPSSNAHARDRRPEARTPEQGNAGSTPAGATYTSPERTRVSAPRPRHESAPTLSGALPAGELAVLTAIAQYGEAGLDRDQLSVLTGYKRSSRDAYISRLQGKGLVVVSGRNVTATADGSAALGPDFEPLPTGSALRDYWLGRLPEGERKVLEVLLSAYPAHVERATIDDATGYKRSSRDAYISRLSARRLVVADRGVVRASDTLFDGGH